MPALCMLLGRAPGELENRRKTLARPRRTLPDQLATAADRLAAIGEPVLAEAVRKAREELTRSKASDDNPTLPLYLRKETWERAKAAGSTLDAVEAGFVALLAGRFKPQRPPRGGTEPKSNFSSRASVERQAEVVAYVTAHADELGWSPSPGQVAAAWLEHKYGKALRR
ncbi:aldo-keto reductase family protein [Actinacidiphila glaucinigra]|uniref:hypothetical protein n=1 Tax=Actinacidiphila glaucinigra TaxID=235986 RepID=UPI00367292CD